VAGHTHHIERFAAGLTATLLPLRSSSVITLATCSRRRKSMRNPASKIAFIGLLTLLVGASSSNAASPLLSLGTHEGVLIPIVLCPGGKTARCEKKRVCKKKGEVAVCMCSVEASGTGELVCCRWKCSEGPF
jgi:hypothetical protein